MDIDQFQALWANTDRDDLDRMLATLESDIESVDGILAWRRATAEMSAVLRRAGQSEQGCRAAHRVSVAAMTACTQTGLKAREPARATRLARAAGDAALAVVVGAKRGRAGDHLLRPFTTVLVPVA